MVPDNYKSPSGHHMAGEGTLVMSAESAAIMAELKSLKLELIEDMKEISKKLDGLNGEHFQLKMEVSRIVGVYDTKIGTLERNITELWDHQRETREKITSCKTEMEKHQAETVAIAGTKKGVSEWVRWIPGIIFGIIAATIAIMKAV